MSGLKTYIVTTTFKYPAAGYSSDGTIEVAAKNSKDAIKSARKEMSHRGHTRHDGPITYTAAVKAE